MNDHISFIDLHVNIDTDISYELDKCIDLKNFFVEKCPKVKKVPVKKLWNFNKDSATLCVLSKKLLSNITNPSRINDNVTYNSQYYYYQFSEDYQEQFEGAKIHWLINDIKINGLAHPPQGYMQHDLYVSHPGTYRYLSAFGQQMENTLVSVWDTHNKFSEIEPLTLDEWVTFCTEGFLRKNRHIVIESDNIEDENRIPNLNKRFLEVHERGNHHDHCILNNDLALAQMYNYSKPIIFAQNNIILENIKTKLSNPKIFSYKVIENKFLIPSNMNFKGVGIYIDADVMNKDFSHLFLYLDTNDDVAIYKPKSVILFNCGSTNCKKLIPEIVAESTDNYLNKFLWANKISTIPNHIGEGL